MVEEGVSVGSPDPRPPTPQFQQFLVSLFVVLSTGWSCGQSCRGCCFLVLEKQEWHLLFREWACFKGELRLATGPSPGNNRVRPRRGLRCLSLKTLQLIGPRRLFVKKGRQTERSHCLILIEHLLCASPGQQLLEGGFPAPFPQPGPSTQQGFSPTF